MTMRVIAMTSLMLALVPTGTAGGRPANDLPPIETILQRMKAYDEWQHRHLLEYQVKRTFRAANPRFNLESMLEVRTTFRKPNSFESEVIRSEGSNLIREKVFDKILEAENEARNKEQSVRPGITPENYNFTLMAQETCDGRPCYHLKITPKQKDKFNIEGEIWVDAEDGAIGRIHGSPAKRPSFWTLHTEIDRRYKRINGFWLFETMESNSDIFIGGHSNLRVDHLYVSVVSDDTVCAPHLLGSRC
jgi:hypothetical protein